MTTDIDQPTGSEPIPRVSELVLARAHLRLGLLALARTELEAAAATGGLDPAGLVDLAEVRWRTGDLRAAGQAADAALESGMQDPVAYVIASEAAADKGRPSEARRLASQAMAVASTTIDIVFAGMPRSNVWAPDANEPLPLAPTLFDRPPEAGPTPPLPNDATAPTVSEPATDPSSAPMTLGLWASDEGGEPAVATLPDPAEAFDAGRSALVEGAFDEAAFHLGLALRLAPALSPAVLEVTDGARARSLILARGDAYRLAGHETEARQAYAIAAAGGLPERRARVRVKSMISAAEATAILRRIPPEAPAAPEIEAPAAAEQEGDTHPIDVAELDSAAEQESGDAPTSAAVPDAGPEAASAGPPHAGPEAASAGPPDDDLVGLNGMAARHDPAETILTGPGSAGPVLSADAHPTVESQSTGEPATSAAPPILSERDLASRIGFRDELDEEAWSAPSDVPHAVDLAGQTPSEASDDPATGPGGFETRPDAPTDAEPTDAEPTDAEPTDAEPGP